MVQDERGVAHRKPGGTVRWTRGGLELADAMDRERRLMRDDCAVS